MRNNFKGELRIKDSLDEIDYFVYDNRISKSESISKLLDNIYKNSLSKKIDVIIKYISSFKEKHTIIKTGTLNRNLDKYGIESYFISDYPLDLALDELVGFQVEIFIEDHLEKDIEDFTYDKSFKR